MSAGHHSAGPKVFSDRAPVKVLVTGAAGQIAYSLVFLIARGEMFGPTRRVILHLLDIPGMETKLEGLKFELEDCAHDILTDVVCTTDYAVAFRDIDVALLVGARPRGPGMERKDLLQANAAIFKGQGEALDTHAKKSVRVLVVGNPANTNALIACHAAPSIPKSHVTCLTRLDLNRARAALAKRVGARPGDVTGCLIWGNHSTTQFPDARYAMVAGTDPVRPHDHASVSARLQQLEGAAGPAWLHSAAPDGFLPLIQGRGKAVIDKRGASSAGSAAQAICDHMRDWWCGSGGRMVCMGVHTSCLPLHPGTGQPVYAVPRDLIFSLPLVCEGVEPEESRRRIPATAPADGGAAVPGDACGYRIVTDLGLDDFTKGKLAETTKELLEERELALGIPQDA